MRIHSYYSASGKDLILDYIDGLSNDERADGLSVLEKLSQDQTQELTIKKWKGKILEVYFYKHKRIFYVAVDNKDIYLLHACKKQKNETEMKDSAKVIQRAKEVGTILSKKFI